MTDLKLKYSKIFKQKFAGNTATSNIVSTTASTTTDINPNFFNRNVKKI